MKARLPQYEGSIIKMAVGSCPACATYAAGFPNDRTVIYRRSRRSITMRCEQCGLQWTMTWVKVHQATSRLASAVPDDKTPATSIYEQVRDMTEFALERETRGRAIGRGARS